MSNKGIDWEEISTGNWNVAKPYTSEKILKWLVKIDDYQTISVFGFSNLESDVFVNNQNLKNTSRLFAFRRLIHTIITLIRNTKFALKKKEHREEFLKYNDRLLVIEKHLDKLKVEKKRGSRVVEIDVNEDLFEKMMEEISGIIDNVNYMLNYSDLIFTHTEEYDPKKVKDSLKNKYINRTEI